MPKLRQHGALFYLLDVVFNVVVIFTIVAVIRTFLVSPFQVEGSSMVDTLEDNEYIVINKLVYFLTDPKRGEIVVFRPPNDPKKYYVKRVIGLPGDVIVIRSGNVYVRAAGTTKETPLDEPYLDAKSLGKTFRHPPGSGDTSRQEYTVPADQYFLLGDNRQGSLDSRSFIVNDKPAPFVPEQDIKGRVWFVALPISKLHALETPEYEAQTTH